MIVRVTASDPELDDRLRPSRACRDVKSRRPRLYPSRGCGSRETLPHWICRTGNLPRWGSDREPSDSFESVRFDSRSPNFPGEVRRTYYIVCVDNVTFGRDYIDDSKKTIRNSQKGSNLRATKAIAARLPAETTKQRANKVATHPSMRRDPQPALVWVAGGFFCGIGRA